MLNSSISVMLEGLQSAIIINNYSLSLNAQ